MSEPRENLDISDLKETFLECPVCLGHFDLTDKRPRLLNACLHAFCTDCLQQLLDKEGKGQITCPLCRNVHKVHGNISTISVDPVRSKLVEYAQIKLQKRIPCTDCPDGADAESRCQVCSFYFCKECVRAHKRNILSREHAVVNINDIVEQPLRTFTKNHFCPHHPTHRIEFYCTTDETLCCVSCSILEHQGHKFQKIGEAWESKKQDLESGLKTIIDKEMVLQRQYNEEERWKESLQREEGTLEAQIKNAFSQLSKCVEERETEVLDQARQKRQVLMNACSKSLSAMEQSLGMIRSTREYFEQTTDKSDAVESLQVYPSLIQCLKGFGTKTSNQTDGRRCHVKFLPLFVPVAERLTTKAGLVTETDDTDVKNYDGFVQELMKMATESSSKEELLKKILSQCTKCHCRIKSYKAINMIKCGHRLCPGCFQPEVNKEQRCPVCNKDVSVMVGTMPPGEMMTEIVDDRIPGYKEFRTIKIRYKIKDGGQGPDQPDPGEEYRGIDKTAYLPDSPEGRSILALLRLAWDRKLTFQIKRVFLIGSILRSRIPHKERIQSTSFRDHIRSDPGFSNGYPDATYLDRVKKKLAELKVTEDDITDTEEFLR